MPELAHMNQESLFSEAVSDAFRKRSKALARRGALVECKDVKEIIDGHESKRGRTDVTVLYRIEAARVQLRLHAFGDRWVWVDARRGSKEGWVWEFTSEGRFISSGGARRLVECVEETIDASSGAASDTPRLIAAIWSKQLATGPRRA